MYIYIYISVSVQIHSIQYQLYILEKIAIKSPIYLYEKYII